MRPTLSQRARRAPSCKSRARGGAFLGLIAGIIVGLAVALGVALYIAKVPIPFVNNVPVHNDEQNGAEAQKNRDWNPNAALQSHGPVQPASDAASAPQQPVIVPPPVEVEPGQSAANPPASAQTRPASDDALGDFAAARAQAASSHSSAASPARDAAFVYLVQTGAFRSPQDADAERARLLLLGMEASVTEGDQAGREVYRVRVGPFQNKAAADQISARLTNNGFEAALVRVQR